MKLSCRRPAFRRLLLAFGAAVMALAASGCGGGAAAASAPGVISAIGAESQYANVLSQIGGRYVHVTAILDNPSTDPHSFETSPQVASEVSAARLIVQNGLGYDDFMTKIEAATPDPHRKVVVVQKVLGLPDSTPNPHLWYSPATMPAAAKAMAAALSSLQPAHRSYFRARLTRFDHSLQPWLHAIAAFKAAYPHTAVATTEPVGDALLQAAGTSDRTPFAVQADLMNGVDPSPQAIAAQDSLLAGRKVAVLVYNQQVTDSLTASFLQAAARAGVPVVGVYETMPAPGYSYQSWMLAEITALRRAVADRISTRKLGR